MAKVVGMNGKLSKREKVARAIRIYEQRKEALSKLIEKLRDSKNPRTGRGS